MQRQGTMIESEKGRYVLLSDHDAAMTRVAEDLKAKDAELARARAEIAELKAEMLQVYSDKGSNDADYLKRSYELYDTRKEAGKLKSLILLTDESVSNYEMNELSAKQWQEFTRWQIVESKKEST